MMRLLDALQRGFALWVLLGAIWGYGFPEAASAGKDLIPEMLAAVMLGMGLTLTQRDLAPLKYAGKPVAIGVCLQFLVMPLLAWLLARACGLPRELAIGLILVGAAPGGTASNVITFLARGDVALSVTMTSVSTLLAPLLTPLWIWLLASAWLSIDPLPLLWTVSKIVLLPVLAGILLRRLWQPSLIMTERLLPLFSIGVIAWIVGVITGLNHDHLPTVGVSLLAAVMLLNLGGLVLGYLGARRLALAPRQRRTVAIEVGMQNSGLAVALAVAHFDAATALAGALFSIWHNISGPIIAGYWRRSP